MRIKKILTILLAVLFVIGFMACNQQTETSEDDTNQTPETVKTAKYVFIFIGDGMALPQINSAEIYLGAQGNDIDLNKLSFTEFPSQGLTTTFSSNSYITDSAAAGTALACGKKTNSGVISQDINGENLKTVAEIAKEQGKKVGIVSSVSIDHATPAVFYAHEPTRKNYYEIDMALAKSNFDYFAGGGMVSPRGKDGNQEDVYEVAKNNGFKIVEDKAEFNKITKDDGKVIAFNPRLAGGQSLYYAMDNTNEDISLAEFTKKGIELLDNPNGFFLMVEGGKIDWACHANDAGAAIHDTLAFDEAVREAIKFYNQHKDETLIIITGDHECGGMTIGFAGTKYDTFFTKLKNQTMSYEKFDGVLAEYKTNHSIDNAQLEDIMDEIEMAFGLRIGDASTDEMALTDLEEAEIRNAFERSMIGEEEKSDNQYTYLLYGGYEPLTMALTHTLNRKAGISWTTYSHTGVPVPTFAIGTGHEMFNGYYDNTDIFEKMMSAMKQG